jgi:hypothetical protein
MIGLQGETTMPCAKPNQTKQECVSDLRHEALFIPKALPKSASYHGEALHAHKRVAVASAGVGDGRLRVPVAGAVVYDEQCVAGKAVSSKSGSPSTRT